MAQQSARTAPEGARAEELDEIGKSVHVLRDHWWTEQDDNQFPEEVRRKLGGSGGAATYEGTSTDDRLSR